MDDYNKRAAARAKEDSILKAARDESPSFLEGVLIPKNAKEEAQKREDSIQKALTYDPKKVKPYILQLYSAYFSAKVNNDYFINRYQPYKNYQGQDQKAVIFLSAMKIQRRKLTGVSVTSGK